MRIYGEDVDDDDAVQLHVDTIRNLVTICPIRESALNHTQFKHRPPATSTVIECMHTCGRGAGGGGSYNGVDKSPSDGFYGRSFLEQRMNKK